MTYPVFTVALDDVVKVGPGSLPIGGQALHLHLLLLSEDVLLNEVVFVGHAAHRVLLRKRLSRLPAEGSHL